MTGVADIPRRRLPLKIFEIELAFEAAASFDLEMLGESSSAFLDVRTGEVVWAEDDEERGRYQDDDGFLEVPAERERMEYRDLEAFIATLPDGLRRSELNRAIEGRGAFRRFKDIIHGSGDIELRHAWSWFETRRRRERIVAWLNEAGIEPEWDCDIFQPPELVNRRPDLLRAVLEFVQRACRLDGVRRIALLGSLATDKPHPKDVDLLVVLDDTVRLGTLAKLKRQLQGKTMQTGDSRGADVFLAKPDGEYIGRICQWRECRPGIRQACQAQHCGRREYLYDDLQNVRLSAETVARPPIELWPSPGASDAGIAIPRDVAELLLEPLKQK
jgi:predicted nucleotidyltransferase